MSLATSSEPPVPPMAKRLKPQTDPDQNPVHCPRCDSSNTKFCYYNNYSLSQPRYFCKSCRRYWTKGGTLRNIPIGGVSRKSKKLMPSLAATQRRRRELQPQQHYDKLPILPHGTPINRNSIGLQLSYPSSPAPFSENPDFMFEDLTIDFMESVGGGRDYEAGDYIRSMVASGGYESDTGNIHGLSPFGEMTSYYDEHYEKLTNGHHVKPKLLDLGWRDQTGCHSDLHGSGVGKNGSSGYVLDIGPSWAGLINGYGSSSTSPLV